MTPLRANLKHFYQCRALYLWYAYVPMALLIPTIGTAEGKPWAGMFWFIPVLMVGFGVASIVRDVMTRPFSFGLPGHREVVTRMLLRVGAVLVPAAGLAFLLTAAVTRGAGVGDLVCGVAVAAAAYVAGVALVFGADWNGQGIFILVLPLYFFPQKDRLCQFVETVLHAHLWGVSAVAFVAGALLLPWCSPARCARKACGRPWIGPGDQWNKAKLLRARKERMARKQGAPSAEPSLLERVVLPRLARSGPATLVRDVWGEALAIGSHYRPVDVLKILGFFVTWVVVFGLFAGTFLPQGPRPADSTMPTNLDLTFVNLFSLFPILIFLQSPSPFFSTLPLASGRRERFRREVVTGGWIFVASLVAMGGIVQFCRWISPAIPSVAVGTLHLALRPPDLAAVWALLWIVPARLMLRLAGPRGTSFGTLLVMVLLLPAILLVFLLVTLPAVIAVGIAIGAWMLYGALAWHTATKRDWVG